MEEYNPGKKRKVLIVFDGMIANMINVLPMINVLSQSQLNSLIIRRIKNIALKDPDLE